MDDIVQLALDPAVTVTVIACLTLVIVLQHLDGKRRRRDLIKRLGRMTGTLLTGAANNARLAECAKVLRAVELTFELKDMNPDLTLDELLFGAPPTWNDVRAAADPFPKNFADDILAGRPMGPRPYFKAAVTVGRDGETVSVRGQPRNLTEFDRQG